MFEFQTLSTEKHWILLLRGSRTSCRCEVYNCIHIHGWKSSLNLLPLEIQEKCNEKISIVLSIRDRFESKSKKMSRMLLIYTTCTFAVVYKLWITTIAKYILIQLKSICDKTLATKVERRLIVEIKWTIMFANSFIWFCVPSNIPHHIWPEFLNFIGLETS